MNFEFHWNVSVDFALYKLNVFGNPIVMLFEAVIRSPLMF